MNRYFVGIDPGATGAIGAVDHRGDYALVIDMPLWDCCGAKVVDTGGGWEFRSPGAHISVAVEKVHAMPGQGVTSMFNFGMMYGGAIELGDNLATNPAILVTPQTWKKFHGLIGKDKDAARLLALEKWPAAAAQLKRKKDVGRADALLIADWLRAQEY